ncbi:MAG: hypothetical protein JNL98_17730 [Bryobacterales bacterium]|nr:hypothetical protein [Bryobacterales bacterium]
MKLVTWKKRLAEAEAAIRAAEAAAAREVSIVWTEDEQRLPLSELRKDEYVACDLYVTDWSLGGTMMWRAVERATKDETDFGVIYDDADKLRVGRLCAPRQWGQLVELEFDDEGRRREAAAEAAGRSQREADTQAATDRVGPGARESAGQGGRGGV